MQIYTRKMKTVTKKNLEVFDFKEETEVPELALRIKSKLENPKSAIDKYTFLATAAAGKDIQSEEINYAPSISIDAINIDHIATTLVEDLSAEVKADSNDAFLVAEEHPQCSAELGADLSELEASAPAEMVKVATTSASPSSNRLNSAILDLLPSLPELDETLKMDADEKGSMCERSSTCSDVAEDDGVLAGPSSDQCIGGWEMDNEDIITTVFHPDYVVYGGSYYTDSMISFTSSFIEMEGSPADGDNETFKCKWGIEDVLHIRSHWYERVEMAMVKIHILTNDTILQTENVGCTSGMELKFAIPGSSWYGRLEAIMSLNVTYKALWSSILESEDAALGHTGTSFSKYLPTFDRPFEEVVYPKGDADAVSISKRDFDLLQPDTFVNDTIIDFYIKYLKNKIKPEERHRFHFFNSFFFRKLADPDKDALDASKGKAGFQRVKKWTRKVNLFEKDYVFIPVNYNYHWSLVVICHLGDVATYNDEDVIKSAKVPCILHMDSIRGSHSGLKGLVQSYLKEEWIGRQQEASEDLSSRFDDLRFISLELPQQQNSFDCGLFLLHYVELFLEQAPSHFNPFKITKSFKFLNVDWFPPAEASLKRVVIQRLICDLLEKPHEESVANEEQCNVSSSIMNVHKGSVVNLDCNPSMPHDADDGTEICVIPSSSIQCQGEGEGGDDPLKSSFELGSLHFPAFAHTNSFNEYKGGSLTPIEEQEEDVEGGGQFVYSQTDDNNGMDFRSWNDADADADADLIREKKKLELSPETSISGCEDSIEIVNENKSEEVEVEVKRKSATEDEEYVVEMVDACFRYVGGSDNSHPSKKMRMT
ncbi:hypothetical protein OSB04_025923 [Centaurea solstitialis]|uniref:Ubiquitin-like protease family profile domain-containing protein n=1 Tax=Centaurea solstitialis TaxID=347529 RepID=A0AA38WF78_9ASTR|nr:hypothetical protein OSB04_025923 [Centaurea solstitialis]